FKRMIERKRDTATPLRSLLRTNKKQVVLAAVIFIGNNAAGYLVIAFLSSYAQKSLGMPAAPVLLATLLASFGWLIFTLYGGILSDRIGRVRTFQIGYALIFVWMIPMFMMIDTRNIWAYGIAIFILTIGLGLSYGPMSAMYAEMFPANVRYSGIGIGYALGAILGGAFAPLIAQALLGSTGWSGSIGIYIMVLCVISFIGASMVRETKGAPLEAETEDADARVTP
ncbi:MFS transporter, partial [Arthrobacter agilis]